MGATGRWGTRKSRQKALWREGGGAFEDLNGGQCGRGWGVWEEDRPDRGEGDKVQGHGKAAALYAKNIGEPGKGNAYPCSWEHFGGRWKTIGTGHKSERGNWLEAALIIQQETDGGLDWGGEEERNKTGKVTATQLGHGLPVPGAWATARGCTWVGGG